MQWIVMGVSASGKSSLAAAGAAAWGWRFIEGDALHSAAALAKMSRGVALTERDRLPWVRRLGQAMAQAPGPVVASASLLRRKHREMLREAIPGLRLLHLLLPQSLAQHRASARAHFFPASLVHSQYLSLESTQDEPGVVELDADQSLTALLEQWRAHCLAR